MKTNRRGRLNGGKAKPQSQTKTISKFRSLDCADGAPRVSEDNTVLGLMGMDDEGFVAAVAISPDQFQALHLAAKRAGKSVGEVLAGACDQIVASTIVTEGNNKTLGSVFQEEPDSLKWTPKQKLEIAAVFRRFADELEAAAKHQINFELTICASANN